MRVRGLGMFLLSIWLIAFGLIAILQLNFIFRDLFMGILALLAGLLLLLRR
jgi:hypothetical protein